MCNNRRSARAIATPRLYGGLRGCGLPRQINSDRSSRISCSRKFRPHMCRELRGVTGSINFTAPAAWAIWLGLPQLIDERTRRDILESAARLLHEMVNWPGKASFDAANA